VSQERWRNYNRKNFEKRNIATKIWGLKNKERVENQNLKRYGITRGQKIEMIEKQNYKCLICGTDLRKLPSKFIGVDHCHKTGIVRGILCSKCNNGLGCFDDNAIRLISAIRYLEGR